MARFMAAHYQTEYVPEVAREMISSNSFTSEDIIQIGKAQNQRVREKLETANKVLFCDTDLITTQIYCRHYLKEVPPILFDLEKEIKFDHYFLFDIDVPWVADNLRDLHHQRDEMFQVFRAELEERAISYVLVTGNWEQRQNLISEAISYWTETV